MADEVATRPGDPAFGAFVRRVMVVLLCGAAAFVLWRLATFSLIMFGAILMAVGLRAATRSISNRTGIAETVSLTVTLVLFLVGACLVFWLFGSIIGTQVDELKKQLPAGLGQFTELIESSRFARYALEQARGMADADMTGRVAVIIAGMLRSLASAAGYAVIMLFLAVYIAAQPEQYRRMLIKMVPPLYLPQANRLLDQSETILRRWLVGQVIVMASIGVLAGVGLWVIGSDAPVALGLLSGVLTFIPYIGAVLSSLPAILIALNAGHAQALWVLLLYFGVHAIEGYLITPLVQAEATALPPVVSLAAVVVVGVLFGPAAVLIATPLTLFFGVVIRVVYIETILGLNADAD